MSEGGFAERLVGTDIVPDYTYEDSRNHTISLIIMGDSISSLLPSVKSVLKLKLESDFKGYATKMDVFVVAQEKDDESMEEVMGWGSIMGQRHGWKTSFIVNPYNKGRLMAEAIGRATGDILVFLTQDFIIDRAKNARELINQLHVPMDYGVSFVKGSYDITAAYVNPDLGKVVVSSQAPYVMEPFGVTSFGGLKEYFHYFPFRHLSTIRVKRNLVNGHLDFLSNFDEGLDIALGAIAVYEGAGIRTTPFPFVNMLTTPRPPDYDVLKREISIMETYFPDMDEYSGRLYFDYLRGAMKDVENKTY